MANENGTFDALDKASSAESTSVTEQAGIGDKSLGKVKGVNIKVKDAELAARAYYGDAEAMDELAVDLAKEKMKSDAKKKKQSSDKELDSNDEKEDDDDNDDEEKDDSVTKSVAKRAVVQTGVKAGTKAAGMWLQGQIIKGLWSQLMQMLQRLGQMIAKFFMAFVQKIASIFMVTNTIAVVIATSLWMLPFLVVAVATNAVLENSAQLAAATSALLGECSDTQLKGTSIADIRKSSTSTAYETDSVKNVVLRLTAALYTWCKESSDDDYAKITQEQIIGIVANMLHESGGKASADQNIGPKSGHGLFQWTEGRYENAKAMGATFDGSDADIDAQIAYFLSENDTLNYIQATYGASAESCYDYFLTYWERAGARGSETRPFLSNLSSDGSYRNDNNKGKYRTTNPVPEDSRFLAAMNLVVLNDDSALAELKIEPDWKSYGDDNGDIGRDANGNRVTGNGDNTMDEDTHNGVIEGNILKCTTDDGFLPDDYETSMQDSILSMAKTKGTSEFIYEVLGGRMACVTLNADIDVTNYVEIAVSYAWPTKEQGKAGAHPMYVKYYTAVGTPGPYNSCDRTVATAIRASGADSSLPFGNAQGIGTYCINSPRWAVYSTHKGVKGQPMTNVGELQPGDILYRVPKAGVYGGHGHVAMYVGTRAISSDPNYVQSRDNGKNLVSGSYGSRYPNWGTIDNSTLTNGYDYVLRCINAEGAHPVVP